MGCAETSLDFTRLLLNPQAVQQGLELRPSPDSARMNAEMLGNLAVAGDLIRDCPNHCLRLPRRLWAGWCGGTCRLSHQLQRTCNPFQQRYNWILT